METNCDHESIKSMKTNLIVDIRCLHWFRIGEIQLVRVKKRSDLRCQLHCVAQSFSGTLEEIEVKPIQSIASAKRLGVYVDVRDVKRKFSRR